MSAQKIIISALSGVVAGVAIGMLMAPAKGSDTRQKIADGASNLKNKMRKLRGATAQELDELTEVFENEVQGLKDDVRKRVLQLLRSGKSAGNHIREEALS